MSKTTKAIQIPQYYQPFEYQIPLLQAMDSGVQKALLVWPRQIGKDTTCWAYMCKQACRVPGNYFYIFPTQAQAKKALWTKILPPQYDSRKIVDFIPDALITRKLEQEMFIELTNGSTIKIEGLEDDPEKIRGISPTGVVFSEFAFSNPEGYRNLKAALRGSNTWLIINSTPNGRNHFYEMYEAVKDSPEWFVSRYQGLWPDRPGYIYIKSQEEFNQELKEGTPMDEIEREYGCSFNSGSMGSFYADQIEKAMAEDRIGEFPYDNHRIVDTFWDLGVDDSTAVWFRQIKNDSIKFIDFYEASGKELKHFTEMLESKGYRYGTHYLPHDADHRSIQTGKTTATIFEELLDEFNVGGEVEILQKLPVQDGINAVRSRFSRYHFDSTACSLGLKAIELYHRKFDKVRKVFLKDPVHDASSHAADALRMEGIAEDDGNIKGHVQNYIVKTLESSEDY